MRPIVVMLLLSSGACATAHTGAEQAETQNLHIAGAGSLRMTASEGAKVSTIGAPVEKVWDVLKPIYDSLDIPIDNLDGSRHVIAEFRRDDVPRETARANGEHEDAVRLRLRCPQIDWPTGTDTSAMQRQDERRGTGR
jgi:hypothetical protein